MKIKSVLIVFCVLMGSILSSKTTHAFKISGVVLDETKMPVPGARIMMESQKIQMITEVDGKFVITGLSANTYELKIFAQGYSLLVQSIELKSDTTIEFVLKPVGAQLQTFVVEGEDDQQFSTTRLNPVEGTSIYAGKKNEVVLMDKTDANTATNNSRQVFAKVVGLNIWESDAAGLQLGIGGRGLSPNRTSNFNTRQNGYDISADALGYPESYYTPPTEMLDRVEVIRGASSLQYGTQFGGVVNFVLKQGNRARPLEVNLRQSIGSFGLYNSYLSLGGTNRRWNYFAAYQFKTGNGWRENSGFRQHTFFTAVSFDVTEKIQLTTDYTHMNYLAQQPGGLSDAMYAKDPQQSLRDRNWFYVDWNLFSLSANITLSPRSQINIRNFGLMATRKAVGHLGNITRLDPGGNRDILNGVFRNIGNETRFLHRYSIRKQTSVFLAGMRWYAGQTTSQQGLGSAGSDADFNFQNPQDLEGSDYLFPSRNASFFSENIFYVNEKFTITPGIRLEYIGTSSAGYYKQIATDLAGNIIFEQNIETSTSRKRWVFLSGIGLSHKTGKTGEWYGNISQNYRAINFSDLAIVNPNYRVDPNILDEYGYTADMGWRGVFRKAITFDVSVFYIDYRNRIGEILQVDSSNYTVYRYRTNIADSYNTGVESFFELDVFRLFNDSSKNALLLFSNLSFIQAYYLESEASSISGNKVELVPNFTARNGVTFRSKAMSVTYQFSYTSEQFTDATNAITTSNAVGGLVPAYWVMDLSASYTWKFLKLETGVNNLTDNRYFTRRATGYPGPGIMPADARNFYVSLQVKF
jgi:Fe(3+) dicitrate transport protein